MNENERIYLGRTKAGKGEGRGERATRTGFSYRGFRFKHGTAEAQKKEGFIQSGNLRLVAAAVLKISTSVRKPRRYCRFGAECCKINVLLLLSGSIHPTKGVYFSRSENFPPLRITLQHVEAPSFLHPRMGIRIHRERCSPSAVTKRTLLPLRIVVWQVTEGRRRLTIQVKVDERKEGTKKENLIPPQFFEAAVARRRRTLRSMQLFLRR